MVKKAPTAGKRRSLPGTGGFPEISVVMPAYNHETYIGPAVDSVRNQTFGDWELIIVDDGSTDATGSIADSLSGGPVRVLHQENKGTAAALNRGIGEARGEFVALLNSDDIYRPERFDRLIGALKSNPGASFALSAVTFIDDEGNVATSGPAVKWLAEAEKFYRTSGNFFLSVLRDNFTCTSSNFLFRRKLIDEIGAFRDFRYVNDLDFLLRSASIGPPVFVDERLLSYRIHGGNTLAERKRKKKKEFLLELAWIAAVQLDAGRIYEIADPKDIFAVLETSHGLRMDGILFCLMELRRGNGDAEILFADQALQTECLKVIDRTLKRTRFISNLHAGEKKLLKENRKLFGLLGEKTLQAEQFTATLSNKNREIARLMEERDEIWRSVLWHQGQMEYIMQSRTYRIAVKAREILFLRNVKHHARELIKALIPSSVLQFVRSIRRYDSLQARFRRFIRRKFSDGIRCLRPVHGLKQKRCDGPLLSVIVPCYNQGEYLERLMASLDSQTFRNFETVIVDDGSDDSCTIEKIAEIEQKQNPRLTVIRQENRGVIGARRRALAAARGKYIFPLDSDDAIDPTFIEKCLLFLESSPPNRLVYAWTYTVGAETFVWETRDSHPLDMLEENRMGLVVYPREAFEAAGFYNDAMRDGYEDWEFNINLVSKGFVGKVIPEPLYFYHVKPGSRNWHAQTKHEELKRRISGFHRESIARNLSRLRRLQRRRYAVQNPLVNLCPAGEAAESGCLMIDLFNKEFEPAALFRRIFRFCQGGDRRVILTIHERWRRFFDLNSAPGLAVYYPGHYHDEGKKDVLYEYLRRKYNPSVVEPSFFDNGDDAVVSGESEKIKILYVAPWLITGGADSMTVDWFRYIDESRFEKYFITTLPRDNTWIDKIRGRAREIYDLPFLRCADYDRIRQFIIDFIAERGIDILHVMNSPPAYESLPYIKEAHPHVITVAQFHCFDYLADGKKVGYPYDVPLRYDAYVDYYNVESVNVKKEIMREFPYLGEGKFRLIYGCIDAESFKPAAFTADPAVLSLKAPDALNILFVGRLDRQKQPLVMAEAARRLRDRGVPFIVHVIGDGSLESQKNELLRFIEAEGLSGSIRLYGDQPLEKLPSWYEVGDVLLLTSAWEGIPMVLYQAMLAGLVCVAPDVGGVAELVRPEHGFLVKDSGDSEAYAEILARLAGDPGARRKLGLRASDFIRKNYDIHVVREAYEAFYAEALSGRRKTREGKGKAT